MKHVSVRSFFGACLALGFLVAASISAQAIQVTATVTADNHYGLYYGAADGSGLTFVGRNELGFDGGPGTYNWSQPETFAPFNGGVYLYVVAWDTAGPQGWMGQFDLGGGQLLSNATDWECYVSRNANPGEEGALPLTNPNLMSEIASATWSSIGAASPNGSSPWGTIPGINSNAYMIWNDTLSESSNSDQNYVIFRTKDPVIPEPASLTLIGLGLVGLASRKLRRRR